MGKSEDLYFGYKKLQEIAYKNNDRGYSMKDGKYIPNINLSRTLIDVIVDINWLEKFEECLPYVENCINELRSFLKNEDEVMSIELSNKIDVSKTLTYMTQHVDAIIEFDEIDEVVTPGKLVNTVYENTFDIYENRFLFSLINKCNDFLGDLYRDVEKIAKKNFANISFDYQREDKTSETNNDMSVALIYDRPEKSRTRRGLDLDKMSRLTLVHEKLNELTNTDLIQTLRNCKEVTDPLTMTNVLQKNPNFIKAVSLWNFIMTYDGKKLEIVEKDKAIPISPLMKENFYELASIVNLTTRLYIDNDFHKEMERKYKRYEHDEKVRLQKIEKEKVDAIKKSVTNALEEKYDRQIKNLQDKIYLCQKKIEHYRKSMNASKSEIVENFMAELDKLYLERKELELRLINKFSDDLSEEKEYLMQLHLKHEAECEERIAQAEEHAKIKIADMRKEFKAEITELNKRNRDEINKLKFAYESQIQEIELKYNEKISQIIDDKNNEIKRLKEQQEEEIRNLIQEYELKIADLVEKHLEEIHNLTTQYEEQIHNLIEVHEKQINDLNEKYTTEIRDLKLKHVAKINELQKEHAKEISELNEKHFAEMTATIEQYEDEIDEINKVHNEQVTNLTNSYESQIETLNHEHEEEVTNLTNSYEAKIAALNYEHEIYVENLIKKYEAEIDKLNQEHDEEVTRLVNSYETQIATLKKEHEEHVTNLTTSYETQIADINFANEKHVTELTNHYENVIQTKDQEREKIIADNEALIIQKDIKHSNEIRTLVKDYEYKIANNRANIQKLSNRLENNNSHYEKIMDQRLGKLQKELDAKHHREVVLINRKHTQQLANLKTTNSKTQKAKIKEISNSLSQKYYNDLDFKLNNYDKMYNTKIQTINKKHDDGLSALKKGILNSLTANINKNNSLSEELKEDLMKDIVDLINTQFNKITKK